MDSDNEPFDVEFCGGTNQKDNRELQKSDEKQIYGATTGFSSINFDQNVAESNVNNTQNPEASDKILPFDVNVSKSKLDGEQDHVVSTGHSSFDQSMAQPESIDKQDDADDIIILPYPYDRSMEKPKSVDKQDHAIPEEPFSLDQSMVKPEVEDKQNHAIVEEPSLLDQTMAQPIDDPFKTEALIKLEINDFEKFVGIAKSSSIYADNRIFSDPVYIRGMTWKIFVGLQNYGKEIGLSLQCESNNPDDRIWSCAASADLRLCSVHDDSMSFKRPLELHNYDQRFNVFGYKEFFKTSDLFDAKDNFIKDDTVCFEAFVKAEVPHSANWNSKDRTGYNGLENQGATCYMNSILQMFFFTNKLRNAVYLMPTEKDQAESSVALEMQRVFYELQHSQKAVDTRKLTKSFGWNSYESFQQHDVQEFCRILMDNLESKMAKTPIEGTIPQLFKGQMRSYISCVDVDYESSRDEPFYDVQLNVKGKSGVIESLRGYVEPEVLEGDNLYDAGEKFGMQKANKGVKFIAFPPVLHLQLMRFQYNPETDANEKIDDRFEFTDVLDLNEFIEGSSGEYVYCLQAVLVHSGSTRGGHYIVYINTDLHSATPNWCRFNDQNVSQCSSSEAIEANFGDNSTFRNAYMLVYVQKDKIEDVLCPIEIPQELRDRFENEEKQKLEEKNRQKLAEHCYKVSLVTDSDLKQDHFVYDVGDFEAIKNEQFGNTIWVPKNAKAPDFYKQVSEILNLQVDQFRLWRYDNVNHGLKNLKIYRPCKLVPHELGYFSRIVPDKLFDAFGDKLFDAFADNVFYVETADCVNSSKLDKREEVLIFFKFYNAESKRFIYLGSSVILLNAPLDVYSSSIKSMIGLQDDVRLAFYLITPTSTLSFGSERSLNSLDVTPSNGSIIIVEAASNLSTENHFNMALKQAREQIKIEAIPNVEKFATSTSTDTFTFDLQLSTKLIELCELIGKRLNCDSNLIAIWKVYWYDNKPMDEMYSLEELSSKTIKDVFFSRYFSVHDPRSNQAHSIYYSKIFVSTEELHNYRRLQVTLLFHTHQSKEGGLLVPKNCQVKDVLDLARHHFDFDPNGTKKLRLVLCEDNNARVIKILNEDSFIENVLWSYKTLRVEEIPHDQLSLASDETLIPVCHYDKHPRYPFGVGFFVKAVDKEHFNELKPRIKKILNVSEQEFEKFKFSFVTKNRILPLDQKEVHVKFELLEEIRKTYSPYIGIEHANKEQKNKFSSAQKSIVIRN